MEPSLFVASFVFISIFCAMISFKNVFIALILLQPIVLFIGVLIMGISGEFSILLFSLLFIFLLLLTVMGLWFCAQKNKVDVDNTSKRLLSDSEVVGVRK